MILNRLTETLISLKSYQSIQDEGKLAFLACPRDKSASSHWHWSRRIIRRVSGCYPMETFPIEDVWNQSSAIASCHISDSRPSSRWVCLSYYRARSRNTKHARHFPLCGRNDRTFPKYQLLLSGCQYDMTIFKGTPNFLVRNSKRFLWSAFFHRNL